MGKSDIWMLRQSVDRRLWTNLIYFLNPSTTSITYAAALYTSSSVVLLPNENLIDALAKSLSTPIAFNTWEGFGEMEEHADPELTATSLLTIRSRSSPSTPANEIFET